MTLNRREWNLLLVTALVVLGGLTWLVVRRQMERLSDLTLRRERYELQIKAGNRELARAPQLNEHLESIRQQLPKHPLNRDVKTDLSQQVQNLATRANLEVVSLTPERETALDEFGLHEMSIKCSWKGSPRALVLFLYQLQALGPVMDVQDLKVKGSTTNPGEELSGSFIVECAFNRIAVPEDPPATATIVTP